jgi:hypothetical protein
LRLSRASLRRLTRRYRRPIAAALAGLGVLVGLTTIRSGNLPPVAGPGSSSQSPTSVRSGEVAVPVVLAAAGIAATLDVGDVIDVVGISGREAATAVIVAPHARVLELPTTASGLTGSSSAVILLAVAEDDALPLSAASANGALSVLIRPH